MQLEEPWLVAVWPGMGSVALAAGAYLVETLGATQVAEVPTGAYFDVDRIRVSDGLLEAAETPRARLFGWKNPEGRDLLVFLGDAQPQVRGYALCQDLLELAATFGAKRAFTFAAMATPMHPETTPRVFAVSSSESMREEVEEAATVERLESGEITGLNGVLLAAATERGWDGVCLLGEFPYFASRVPNPGASAAVLRVFTTMAGVELDFGEIDQQAEAVRKGLVDLVDRVKTGEGGEQQLLDVGPLHERDDDEDEDAAAALSGEDARKIEDLFEAAAKDRSRATELKDELDRHGIFKDYEDRFLDLFRAGE